MKKVKFLGDTLKSIRDFPADARQNAGFQLDKVERGENPDDFKPMPSIGKGVQEIRIWDEAGTFRIIYTARFEEAIYVLHAFQKKTEQTPKHAIELSRDRYNELVRSMNHGK
jgi:phage-related protein